MQPIRVQAAHTLDDTLVIVPRHLAAAPSDLQVAVQRCVLDVFMQHIMLNSTASSTIIEGGSLNRYHEQAGFSHDMWARKIDDTPLY